MTATPDQVIGLGLNELGRPYVYGDEGPNSFDCSGLMQYIFGKAGISLPRTAAEQQRFTQPIASPSPGDLVFYDDASGHATHVTLYIGNGRMLEAPEPGKNVRTIGMYDLTGRTRAYGRVPGIGGPVAAVTSAIATIASPLTGVATSILGGVRTIVIEAGAAALGLALILAGAWRVASPTLRRRRQEIESAL